MSALLLERNTGQLVSADLLYELKPEQLVRTEERWRQFRKDLREQPGANPEHDHWD